MGREGIYANRDYLKDPVQYVDYEGEIIDISKYQQITDDEEYKYLMLDIFVECKVWNLQ